MHSSEDAVSEGGDSLDYLSLQDFHSRAVQAKKRTRRRAQLQGRRRTSSPKKMSEMLWSPS